MSWRALTHYQPCSDIDLSDELELVLNRDFHGAALVAGIGGEKLAIESLEALLSQQESINAICVAWLVAPEEASSEMLLGWRGRSKRCCMTPQHPQLETDRLEQGVPFIQLTIEFAVQAHEDAAVLASLARGASNGTPDTYVVIPDRVILHPWQGIVEGLFASLD